MSRIRRKLMPWLMAFTLVLGMIPPAIRAEEVPETEETIQNEEAPAEETGLPAEDGSFSFDLSSAEIAEGKSAVLKLQRGGNDLPAASVRLSMIDITAKYGSDYTIRILSEQAEEQLPEVAEDVSSIMEEIENDPDSIIEQDVISEAEEEQLTEQGIEEISEVISQELSRYAEEHPDRYTVPVEEIHEETGRSALSKAFSESTGLEDDYLPMSSDGSAVLDLDALLGGYTMDTMADFAAQFSAAGAVIDFAEGETVKYIRIDAAENEEAKGNLLFMAAVFAASDTAVIGTVQSCTAAIIDNEPWQVPEIRFTDVSYTADAGYLTVTLERSGILSGFASVHLSTADGNAVSGRDYSEVDAEVDFVPGVSQRTLRIPVRSKYLDNTSDFRLTLSQAVNCEITQAEAKGVITASSGNYEVQPSETISEDSPVLSIAETSGGAPVSLDLSGGYANTYNNASSSWDGEKIVLKANGWTWDESWSSYNTKSNNEDFPVKAFRAVRLDWKKSGGGDSTTSVNIIYGRSKKWGGFSAQVVTDYKKNSWDRKTTEFLLELKNAYCFDHFYVYDDHNGSPFSSESKLYIYKAEVLPRPMEVTAEVYNKDTLKFVDEYGRYISYEQANLPGVGAFNISGQTNKATLYIGDTVTVTTDDTYTYIKALWIGNKKLTADYPAGTKSAAFKLTPEFYETYYKEISMADSGDVVAKLTVRVELGQYEAPVTLHNDDARGTLEFAFDANKNVIHKGDYVAIKQTINKDYSASHTQSMIHLTYIQRADALDYEAPYLPFNRGSKDTYTFRNIYTDVQAYPVFEKKENRIVVRVQTKDFDYFDMDGGIFNSTGVKSSDGYWDYEVVGSDVIQAGKRYELTAETMSEEYTAVWQPVFKESRYSQSSYWFEADPDPSNNVVMLTAEKADEIPFSLSGQAYFSNYSLVTGTEGEAWMAADGVMVQESPAAYGLSDTTGQFQTIPAFGVAGCKVQYRVIAMGKTEYRTVTLQKGEQIDFGNDIRAYDVPVGTITVSPVNRELPYVSAVSLISGTATGSLIAYMDAKDSGGIVNSFTIFINNEHAPYTDNNGEEKTETVKSVRLYAYDPLTNVIRGQIGGDAVRISGGDDDDRSVWQVIGSLEEGTGFYQASDRIYVRITTDRKQAEVCDENGNPIEFENFEETSYPDLYTGMVLSSVQPEAPPSYDLDILDTDLERYFTLPIFGAMNCTFLIKGFAMSFQMLPGNVHRFCIGKILNDFDYMNDTKQNFDGCSDGVSKIAAFGQKVNGDGKLAPVKNGGVHPFLGIYIDFAPGGAELSPEAMTGELSLIGGGLYGGVKAYGQFNFYLPICCVPSYFGIQLSLTAYVALGMHDAKPISYHTLKDGSAPLKEGFEPDFTFKAEGWFAIYAGVGLACTLGVRGGVSAFGQYIYNPTIQKILPEYDTDGGRITLTLKVWVDAFFFNIPIPVKNFVDEPYGYIKQMEKENEGNSTDASSGRSDVTIRSEKAPSAWLPEQNLLKAAPAQAQETVLQKGGYDHADPQLLDMGDDGVLLVFLGLDTSRPQADQTILLYSVCKNGTWSDPLPIGNDRTLSTADFQPDLCDAGSSVMISWISRENVPYADNLEYLGTMDVYTCMFDKATHEITQIECLSEGDFNDVGYYNCAPVGVYDELSGDRMVYYQKSAAEEKAVDDALYEGIGEDAVQLLANTSPTQNGSFITYLLYDHSENNGQGGWARTHIYENEVSSAASRENLITNWGGQRFLGSPIREEDWNVARPVIIDFDAVSYNGIAVYAYTVDKDNSLDTEYDRDLFLQVYDFETHRTFRPIRIKNDTVSDSRPQLVRSLYTNSDGSQKAHTWLFWLEGVSIAETKDDGSVVQSEGAAVIRYLDAAELIEFGINDDGTIGKDGYDIADETHTMYYQSFGERNDPSLGSYIAYVDKDDDLYICWLQSVQDDTGNAAQEIYASALIDRMNGSAWSDAVRLTKSGMVNDETAVVTDSSNRLITVSNRYTIDPGDAPGSVRDLSLIAVSYQSAGSLEAVSAGYPIEAPLPGETITASVRIRNTGLSPAEEYTVKVYEVRNGRRSSSPLYSSNSAGGNSVPGTAVMAAGQNAVTRSAGRIVPGEEVTESFEWTMPQDLKDGDTLALYVEVSENGVETQSTKSSELEGPEVGAKLELVSAETKEEQDGFYLCYEIRNAGNVASSGNIDLKARFNDLYNEGMEGDWLTAAVDALEPGESRYYVKKMDIADEVFTHGFANGYAELFDENGERMYIGTDFIAAMEFPYHITVNNDPQLEEITLKPGGSLELSGTYGPLYYYKDGTVQFTTGNGEIAHMEGNRLVADEAGTTILRVFVSPYGGEKLIRVTVLGKNDPEPAPTPSPTPKPDDKGSSSSDTGDHSSIPLYAGILGASLAALAAILMILKKNSTQERK